MKLIVLHGDDIEKSRRRLQKFIDTARRRKWEITKVDLGQESLKGKLRSNSLFGQTRLFVIENIQKLKKEEIEFLGENTGLDETVVFFSSTLLTKGFLSSLKTDTIETFNVSKDIWKFLDSFYPGNQQICIQLFHKTIENENAEFVFVLLAGRLKDLYHAKLDPGTLSLPEWRVGKLKSQASKYTKTGLEKIIGRLSEIDIETKTSSSNLTELLDILLVEEL